MQSLPTPPMSAEQRPADHQGEFSEILQIIRSGRAQAYQAVNIALLETYWTLGAYLAQKVSEAGWGKGVILHLAQWLQTQTPDTRGYSAQNLWRMKQFYQTFSSTPKLSAMPRVLGWTHYCTLMGLNRHLSPAMVAAYETQMIPKALLAQKHHEWSQMLQSPQEDDEDEA